jgi:hypothetical protein
MCHHLEQRRQTVDERCDERCEPHEAEDDHRSLEPRLQPREQGDALELERRVVVYAAALCRIDASESEAHGR